MSLTFMPSDEMIGEYFSPVCLFVVVCLLSTITFALAFELKDIYTCILHIRHAYFTTDRRSNSFDTEDIVTFSVTFIMKIIFRIFLLPGILLNTFIKTFGLKLVRTLLNVLLRG